MNLLSRMLGKRVTQDVLVRPRGTVMGRPPSPRAVLHGGPRRTPPF